MKDLLVELMDWLGGDLTVNYRLYGGVPLGGSGKVNWFLKPSPSSLNEDLRTVGHRMKHKPALALLG